MPDFRLIAGLFPLLLALPAHADTVKLSTDSTVYDGPGRQFGEIGTLPSGRIDLRGCRTNEVQESWCEVALQSRTGWINVMLDLNERDMAQAAQQPDGKIDPKLTARLRASKSGGNDTPAPPPNPAESYENLVGHIADAPIPGDRLSQSGKGPKKPAGATKK